MTRPELIQLAKHAAEKYGLDPALVCALCHHESANWNRWAVRYEPAFYNRYVKDMKLSETEKTMRSTSFGLCQVMGQVAREYGFAGDYLTELLDPEMNLKYGCLKLQRCMERTHQDRKAALLQYNGGGDPNYADKVLRHIPLYQTSVNGITPVSNP